MNKKKFYYLLVPLVFLLMSTFSPLQAITFYSASSGPWNSSATWGTSCGVGSGAGIPTAGDDVIICNGYVVSISGTNVCRSINISNGGTLSATTSGNVLTCGSIGTVTIDLGGTFSENQSTGANTFNFQGTFINNGTFTSNASVSNTSTYNFHGNITNTGVFQLINNGFYDFESTLAITPTADMMMGYSGGGGTIRAFENTTINNGAGHITFNGDLDIATGKVFTNNNTTARLKFALNGALTGAGTYVNGTDSYLEYVSNSLPMSGGTFDVDATGNTVDYNRSGDQNNVRATVYFNLTFSGTGNKVLLNTTDVYGNVLIDGSATLVAGSNLLTIVGNFTKTGSATFNAGTGFVMFTAGTPTISGVTNFYGITLTGSSPTVTLSNSITVSYGLYLVNGKIDLDAYDITFTGPTNQLTSGGGWLATTGAGKLIRSLSGSNLLFPVGSATQYQPINIATSATNASVRFGSPTMTVPNSGVGSWYVDNGSTTSDITLISPQGGILTWGDGGSQITRYTNHTVQTTTYPSNDEYTANIPFVGFEEEIGIFTCGVSLDGTPLPDGTEGTPYNEYKPISGGTTPYSVSVTSGSLPAGITATISGTDVVLSGTPSTANLYSFDLQVTDANGCTNTQGYSISVNPPPPPTPIVDLVAVPGTAIAENILQANRQRLYSMKVDVGAAATDFNTLTFTTAGTYSTSDIISFKLYTNSSESIDDFASATLLDTQAPVASGGTITFYPYQNFSPGTNYLYIAVDVSPNSVVGKTVAILFFSIGGGDFSPTASVGSSLANSGNKTITTTGFVTTWQASGGSITIPTTGGGYNYEATCTNITTGTIGNASVSGQIGDVTFSGLTDGDIYQVVITGTFPRIYFNYGNEGQDISKIQTIEQWGNIAWTSMERAFQGCSNLQLNATDTPDISAIGMSLSNMFEGCSAFTGNSSMNTWNTSTVTTTDNMFYQATNFDSPLNSWNVSNVTNMSYMFQEAFAFNQPLNNWNVSNVINMNGMFNNASAFNQPLNSWNVNNATDMSNMFGGASSFNQPLNSWNVNNVTDMNGMFASASAFNQPLNSWNVSNVMNMQNMFTSASSFNQPLNSWNVSNVANMSWMFGSAFAFNQSLATWQLRTAGVNMANMLDNCGMSTANYDATLIGWAGQAGLPTGVTLGATGRTYCIGVTARDILTSAPKNWTITDGGVSGTCPSFKAVTATNITATSFTANWTAGTPPYTLEVANDIGFTSYVAGYNGLNVGNVGSYNVTVPSAGVYYYRVTGGSTSNTKAVSTNLPAGSGNNLTFNPLSNQYIATNANFGLANQSFSIEFWAKSNILTENWFIGVDGLFVTNENLHIGYQNATTFRFSFFANDLDVTTSIDNQWHHWSCTYNASTNARSIYRDGVLLGSDISPSDYLGTTNLFIARRNHLTKYTDGNIDEVKIWNTTRTEAEIRASMCAKLVGTESGLVGYFRLDENTGTTVENKAYLATTDGILVNSPTWATSSAPLGDVSANTYNITNGVTLTNTDVMQASNITGAPAGVHLYKVNATLTGTTQPTNYASLYNDRYWGMFFVGGTSPQATLAYNYSANTTVDVANALRFAQRDNNADLTWASMGGVQNRLSKKLTHTGTSAGEYILAERNALITNYKDGGTVLTYDGSSGYVDMPRYVENDFTIEFWLRTTQNGGGSTDWFSGVGLVDASSTDNDFGISLLGTKVAFGTRSGSATTILSTSNVNDGKWTHVAVTRAGANLVLYIDGKPEATSTTATTATLNGTVNIHIGKLQGGANYFNGSIDELRIWNTALTELTIKDWVNLRAQDQHPNFANLEAYYRFDENTGVLAEDLVNGNDATLTGGVVWADANMPLGDGAVSRLIVPATSGTVSVFPEAGVTMNFGTITPDGEVVATRIDGEPESYPAVAGMSFMNAYWVIRNYGNNQTFSALPEITFEVPAGNTISAADLANPFNIKLYKRPDDAVGSTVGVGNWQAVASATGFGSIRFGGDCCSGGGGGTSIEDYSQFVIGSASSPLPITLLGFVGERVTGGQGNGFTEEVRLEWSTASEINNKGFEVEMSANGLAYTKIAFVEGKGNSTTIQPYSHTTIQPNEAYYRLKQVDFNGTFSYSPVVFVTGMVGKDFVIVYPNPAQADLKLKVSESILPTEILKVEVYNIAGKRVWRGVGKLAEVQASLQTSFHSWKAGTYLLQLRTDKKRLQTKFIKE